MSFSQEFIEELKVVYKKDTGEDISNEEAWSMTTRVFNLFDALLRANEIPEDNNNISDTSTK